ncbi:hypothetical protein [Bacillus smithii]
MKRVNDLSQWTRAKKLSQTALFSSLGGQFAFFLSMAFMKKKEQG